MQMFTKIMLGAGMMAAACYATPSYAAPAGSAFKTSFNLFGTATDSPSGPLSAATTITPVGPIAISNLTFQGFAAGANGDIVTFSPTGFSANGQQAVTVTWDTFTFTSLTDNVTVGSNAVSHIFTGMFTDSTHTLATQTADLSISFNQTATIAFSATFDTPNALPEPASMLVIGTGLIGLIAARRRA